MSNVSIRISEAQIKQAIKSRVITPITKVVQNPVVMRGIGDQVVKILTPYVPMKTGDLRKSTHIVARPRQVKIIWGDSQVGKTSIYAAYQHNSDDSSWHRTTPGTKSFWTHEVFYGTYGHAKLIEYTANIIKKEVKKNGG